MPDITPEFFQREALKRRYIDELAAARQKKLFSPTEHTWLLGPARPAVENDPDPVRVDRLMRGDGSANPFELSAALLLSHTDAARPQVYLFSLSRGVEAYADRHALLAMLRDRFAKDDPDALFEFERLEGDPFKAQALTCIDHQVEQMGRMSAELCKMPSLYDASTASLKRQLEVAFPKLAIDPQTHLLRIVIEKGSNAGKIIMTQTLAEAVFDQYRGATVVKGCRRQFLDLQGAIVGTADALLYTQAMADAVTGVNEHYAKLLDNYWLAPVSAEHAHTRKDMANDCFSASLLRHLDVRARDANLTPATLRALRSVLRWAMDNTTEQAATPCWKLTLQAGEGAPLPLASTFVVQPRMDGDQSLIWFAPDQQLTVFADWAALTAHLASAQGLEQLRPALALDDLRALPTEAVMRVEQHEILTPLIAERVASIIAMQARNLEYATQLSTTGDAWVAMIDDALDVRQLLDPGQQVLGARRWHSEARDFLRTWHTPAPDPVPPPGPLPQIDEDAEQAVDPESGLDEFQMPTWVEQTHLLESLSISLRQTSNVLLDYAAQVLQPYLCVLFGPQARAEDLYVTWSTKAAEGDSTQLVAFDVRTLLLDRVSGHRSSPLPVDAQIVQGRGTTFHSPPAEVIDHMLGKVATGFASAYIQAFQQSRSGLLRHEDQAIQPARTAINLRQDCMRLDLALSKRQGWTDPLAFDMVTQVLDYPALSLRPRTAMMVQAFTLSLAFARSNAMLTDTLVVMRPDDPDSAVMFWSGAGGWQQFTSIQRLKDALLRKLRSEDRDGWLQRLGDGDSADLRQHLSASATNGAQVHLHMVTQDIAQALTQHALARQQQDLRQLCQRVERCTLGAQVFARVAGAAEVDGQLIETLDGLWTRVSTTLFEEMLPEWLTKVPLDELKVFRDMVRRYYAATDGGKKFLVDLPTVHDYAANQLKAQLALDFPGHTIDPDSVIVTARHYVNALPPIGQMPSLVPAATLKKSETLTRYAINRFKHEQDAALSVESADPEVVRLLTPDHLRNLVRTLDVGSGYLALLRKSLGPADPGYDERKRMFTEQLPAMLLSLALEEKFREQLSAKAYQYIFQVFEMPDGIAREPIDKVDVIVSPLRLVADPDIPPDTVRGVYLISSAGAEQGPVVLFALLHPLTTFREFSDQAALLAAIRTDKALQQILLDRVAPDVKPRYDHGGFVEPHLPFTTETNDVPFTTPGPVTLAVEPVKGNALQLMFEDTVKLLDSNSVAAVVTNAQEDQAGREFLGLLGLEQLLMLLPGRLATLVALWQSTGLFQASAASVSGRRWGEALSEFCAALGIMVSAREQKIKEDILHDRHGNRLESVGEESEGKPEAGWSHEALTVEQLRRLDSLQAKNVALKDMDHDALLNLYKSRNGEVPYAVVNGRVYQVARVAEDGHWRIVGADGSPGPSLKSDSHQRWQLDLQLRLRGGGGFASRFRESRIISSVESTIIIEASGMPEIRMLFRDRARRIGQAHLHAKRVLENCLDNLRTPRAGERQNEEVLRIIREFFGVSEALPSLLTKTRNAISILFDAVMDPTLSPFSSSRYVVGTARPGFEQVTAFVIKTDPQRRVFLTEKFFHPPLSALNAEAAAQGFNEGVHHRAANLIHELSHLVLDTEDIAYLDSMLPYPDLLAQDTPTQISFHRKVKHLRERRLSSSTDRDSLFMISTGGVRRALEPADGAAYKGVLKFSGAADLAEARRLFLADEDVRVRVMMGNADSVTLLVLLLGRNRLVPPSP
ncbi:dermonecrotic toxin domain-containing protein [Pseudomonas sp. NPDC090201]|uniref:dermonecrotic toxin domain-containing protein n=1 Tax=Pseudomonas sp. NPDC090201 TaxID=3364475 RepID=UPI0037F8C665